MHLINQLLDDFVRIKSLLLYFGDGLVGVVKTASAGPKANGMEADEDLTEPWTGPCQVSVGSTDFPPLSKTVGYETGRDGD